MDISHWPLEKILKLPDGCFGRRWSIGLAVSTPGAPAVYQLSEDGLPETTIIWGVGYSCMGTFNTSCDIGLSLGDSLPTTEAGFFLLEPVFPSIWARGSGRGHLEVSSFSNVNIEHLKLVLRPGGRRLVGRFVQLVGTAAGAAIAVTVSSIPKEVPDCLFSV